MMVRHGRPVFIWCTDYTPRRIMFNHPIGYLEADSYSVCTNYVWKEVRKDDV